MIIQPPPQSTTTNINGGKIINNTAPQGGGFYLSKYEKEDNLNISKDAYISGNVSGGTIEDGVLSGGTANNVFLEKGTKINIVGALTDVAKIGVTAESTEYPYILANGTDDYALTSSDNAKIVSDNSALQCTFNKLANNITLDVPHTHSLTHVIAKDKTCTENGNKEYWYCSSCNRYFSDENAEDEITFESTVIDKTGHKFTNYIPDNNATYEKDGTETAICDNDGCNETDTRVIENSKLIDTTAPTGEMTISNNSFKNFISEITFGLFFKDSQTVKITASDSGIGVDKIYYYLSNTALSLDDVESIQESDWTEGEEFTINPDFKGIVYAKISDKAENVSYISSNGLVFDASVPVVSGIVDGGKYSTKNPILINIDEENIEKLMLDDKEISIDENGKFNIDAPVGSHILTVTDKAGNETKVNFEVFEEKTEVEKTDDVVKITNEEKISTEKSSSKKTISPETGNESLVFYILSLAVFINILFAFYLKRKCK